jgi:hypothetical protein
MQPLVSRVLSCLKHNLFDSTDTWDRSEIWVHGRVIDLVTSLDIVKQINIERLRRPSATSSRVRGAKHVHLLVKGTVRSPTKVLNSQHHHQEVPLWRKVTSLSSVLHLIYLVDLY